MSARKDCFFLEKCYIKRESHFLEFCHPHLENAKRLEDLPITTNQLAINYRKQYDILCKLGIIGVKPKLNDKNESNLEFESGQQTIDFLEVQREEDEKMLKLRSKDLKMN